MSLSIGTWLGHYDVTALIGQGGMGQVYRARDTKLGRDVALKVLPDVFADDPERLARFQREARVLASLNHPNIASIYGLVILPGKTGVGCKAFDVVGHRILGRPPRRMVPWG